MAQRTSPLVVAFVGCLVAGAVACAAFTARADAGTPETSPIPVHGTVLAVPARGAVIAAIDAVPGRYAAQTQRYRSTAPVRVGETFDAALDPGSGTLADVRPVDAFITDVPAAPAAHAIATPLVVLDSLVFVVGAGLLVGFLIWITKRIIIDERY